MAKEGGTPAALSPDPRWNPPPGPAGAHGDDDRGSQKSIPDREWRFANAPAPSPSLPPPPLHSGPPGSGAGAWRARQTRPPPFSG